jgi:hypothetical protein
MDQDTIQQIAQEIVKHLPSYSWQPLIVQMVLTVLAFVGGIFFGESFRRRVTKADRPDRLRDQTTEETLGEEDWRRREWANLRRIKVEVLLKTMHDCEHLVEPIALGAAGLQHRDPLSELDVITTLYFPELKNEVDGYLDRCRARRSEALTTKENGTKETDRADFKSARDQLSAAAQSLTAQIMGVTGSAPG